MYKLKYYWCQTVNGNWNHCVHRKIVWKRFKKIAVDFVGFKLVHWPFSVALIHFMLTMNGDDIGLLIMQSYRMLSKWIVKLHFRFELAWNRIQWYAIDLADAIQFNTNQNAKCFLCRDHKIKACEWHIHD